MIGLEITKPKRLLAEQETLRPNYGKFIAEPLARGFGTTIGNSLRRVLLSSIEGAAIVAVSIDGISHEYDTIEGVREDVVQIILNLKAIRFLVYIEDPITLHLHAEGSGEVTAADITPSGQVEVINPDQHIAHLDRCDSLDIRLRVLRGRGYALAGEPLEDNLAEGVIPIDAKFSPVNKVDFKVEETRVGHITNFDRLLLEVWTDGSLTAKDAVTEAAKILLDQLNLFTNFDEHYVEPIEVVDEEKIQRDKYLSKPVAELELSVRSANCLEASQITTIRDLVVHTEHEMLKQRNFGKKSLIEIREILSEMGLHLGMDLDDD
jgi:DNA-directed RNA polymerase subunit alpha